MPKIKIIAWHILTGKIIAVVSLLRSLKSHFAARQLTCERDARPISSEPFDRRRVMRHA